MKETANTEPTMEVDVRWHG